MISRVLSFLVREGEQWALVTRGSYKESVRWGAGTRLEAEQPTWAALLRWELAQARATWCLPVLLEVSFCV